tara:strand:+ start:9686 stop:10342 length:657 start_codon:yes stop_codon:yes gene_type:complete
MSYTTENNLEIAQMLLMDYITKEIEECIENGDNQWTLSTGSGFFKEHKENYLKEVIIPYLTTHTNGDSMYSSYQNGKYYYKNDCMDPYEIEYDGTNTICFNRVETESEEEEEEEENEKEVILGSIREQVMEFHGEDRMDVLSRMKNLVHKEEHKKDMKNVFRHIKLVKEWADNEYGEIVDNYGNLPESMPECCPESIFTTDFAFTMNDMWANFGTPVC